MVTRTESTTMSEDLPEESNGFYDLRQLRRFLQYHPGGSNTLKELKGENITKDMKKIKHSPAAFSMLTSYQKTLPDDLVDWSKPMIWQVGSLGKDYYKWAHSPVHRDMRLFESDFLEMLTKTKWYFVVSFWVPVSLYFMTLSIKEMNEGTDLPFTSLETNMMICISYGILKWTLIEYVVHRWLFHLKPRPNNSRIITFHFLIHGIHHKVPFDKDRLLFPPFPAAMVASFLYVIYHSYLPKWMRHGVMTGSVIGYLIYDLIHFYLHQGSPKHNSYLYNMKRYHNHHHFSHQNQGFGISSDIWDRLFSTNIEMKELDYVLEWTAEEK